MPHTASRTRRLLRVQDLADHLGVSRTTIWRWAKAGHLPPARLIGSGSRPLHGWLAEEIDAWLESAPYKAP
ncbi:MAG: helix-turn-helix domain-containing protein [Gemmatimonadales bacterium]|jgi:prophage regulatory protein|nr:helix-turn-helix domain-containing protein [Gemmatimonadales bacterium]